MIHSLKSVALTLALAVTLIAGLAQSSAAAEYAFKYSNTQSDAHPRSKSMVYFKDLVEKKSGGKIKVELFFNGVLGKEAEVLEMVKMGTVQGCRGGLFERANKKFLLYTLPFMFENANQAAAVMAGTLGKAINKGALENGFYIPATGVAGGMRNLTNSVRPIKTVDDIKGLKMRTPPIDVTIRTFKAIGANPQEVPYTETYMALKTGVVDGQENPFSNIVDMKFYEAQKYLSLANWQVHPDPFYVNPAWYQALPADLKKVFDDAAVETIAYSNKIWLESEMNYFNILKDKLAVNEVSGKDRQGFVEAVKGVWKYYVDEGMFTQADIDTALAEAKKN